MNDIYADYVIAGGGTAGSILASRLSENSDTTVALFEAGKTRPRSHMSIPGTLSSLYEKGKYHWDYVSLDEPFAAGKNLTYKLGKVLGGSSVINGMVWVRGDKSDFDDWENQGCTGWSSKDIWPLFDRIEKRTEAETPEDNGKICVQSVTNFSSRLNQVFLDAGSEADYTLLENHNLEPGEGFCRLEQNICHGKRADVYHGYLAPVINRSNMKIHSYCQVSRVLLQQGKAIGIEYIAEDGQQYKAYANKEVLISSGAIASAQLLQISGVGDPGHLDSLGIQVVKALPGVGQNFHTHPTIKFTYQCKQPVSLYKSTRLPGKLLAALQWMCTRSGPASSNQFETGAFLKSHPDLTRPDLELTFLPLALGDLSSSIEEHGFQIYIELIGCKSRGQIKAISPDITVNPEFRFNFLKDERDIQALVSGIEIVRNLVNQDTFSGFTGKEIEPGFQVNSIEEKIQWIRNITSLSHHLVGSCKMGSPDDPLSVVDPHLKVHGIENLRVIDASVMPTVTSGNTHAPVIAIAEKASDLILAEKAR